jgi:hypothetical protein
MLSPTGGDNGLIDVGVHLTDLYGLLNPPFEAKWGYLGIPETTVHVLLSDAYIPFYGMSADLYHRAVTGNPSDVAVWKGDKPSPLIYAYENDLQNYGNFWDVLFRRDLGENRFYSQHGVKHLSVEGELLPRHATYYQEIEQDQFGHHDEFKWFYSTLPEVGGYDWFKRVDSFDGYTPSGYVAYNRPGKRLGRPLKREIASWLNPVKLQDRYCPVPYIGSVGVGTPQDLSIRGSFSGGWYYGDHIWDGGSNWVEMSNANWYPGYAMKYTRWISSWWLVPQLVDPGLYGYGAPLFKAYNRVVGTTWLLGQNLPEAYGQVGPDGIQDWYTADSMTFDRTIESTPVVFPLSDTYGQRSDGQRKLRTATRLFRSRFKTIADGAPALRPSSLLSFSDAIQHLNSTEVNYLEVVAESKELITLIPSIVSIVRAFLNRKPGAALEALSDVANLERASKRAEAAKSLLKGLNTTKKASQAAKALDASLRIGDLLSSSTLLYRFGLKPTAANAADVKNMISSVGPKLKALQSYQTVHGKFSVDFDHDLGPMHLVTRTSARVNGLSDDFLIKLMGLDVLGLAPRTSNFWDVVPWSWFIDYFFQISTRLDAFDAYIMGNLRGLQYAVHSYTLYDQADADLTMRSFQSSHIVGKYYFREVSRLVPGLFGGKYDFLRGRGPDHGITAAILWGLARG